MDQLQKIYTFFAPCCAEGIQKTTDNRGNFFKKCQGEFILISTKIGLESLVEFDNLLL